MIRRAWLIGAALTIVTGASACGDDSGAETNDDSATRRLVAAALSEGIDFANGTVRLVELPETTNDDLIVEQDDGAVSLEPGTASLLPFTADNPEDDDPVVAVLLQFEDGDDEEHVEVDLTDMADGGSGTTFEVSLDVNSNVCNKLCNTTFNLHLLQKLKLGSGAIGRVARRLMSLDCTARGDEDMCSSASGGDAGGDGDGDGDGDTGGTGGSSGTGSNSIATSFNNAATMLNQALCACAAGEMATHCDEDWLSAMDQTCALAAIRADAGTPNVNELAIGLLRIATGGTACTVGAAGAFEAALPNEASRDIPASLVRCAPDAFGGASTTPDAGP